MGTDRLQVLTGAAARVFGGCFQGSSLSHFVELG